MEQIEETLSNTNEGMPFKIGKLIVGAVASFVAKDLAEKAFTAVMAKAHSSKTEENTED